jgi:hypothetical protein
MCPPSFANNSRPRASGVSRYTGAFAFSGSMKLHYKRNIPDEVLQKLPTTTLRFGRTALSDNVVEVCFLAEESWNEHCRGFSR